jgi:SAM-dependent methyltransferase
VTLAPIFVLDEPHYHRIQFGGPHRFLGIALAVEGREIDTVEVYRDGVRVFEAPSNLPCAELAGLRIPRAANCRFDFRMTVERGAPYEIRANGETLFRYEMPDEARLQRISEAAAAKPLPDAGQIAVTQGIGNPETYRDSIVSGLFTLEALLRRAGSPTRLSNVLDVGCGTGRLLIGWHCDDPSRRLVGVDIDAALIAWNRQHLGEVARWEVGSVWPPLDLPGASQDLIQFASVFTHLPLDCQRAWLSEVRRLLRPGGSAVVSLHGMLYATLLLDGEARAAFDRTGYHEIAGGAEGGSGFGTFHSPAFARELFADFAHVAHFERGIVGRPQRHFPIASLQDVWVIR